MSTDTLDFWRAVVLKTAFHPEPLRRVQAALIYRALENVEFTADEIAPELINGDTHIAGIAVGALAGMGLLERCGRCRSPAPSRNGCWVNRWRIGQRAKAVTWLARNNFPAPEARQLEIAI